MDIETELGQIWVWIGDIPPLQQYFEIIWKWIGVECLDSLICSIPDCLSTVIAAKSNANPY